MSDALSSQIIQAFATIMVIAIIIAIILVYHATKKEPAKLKPESLPVNTSPGLLSLVQQLPLPDNQKYTAIQTVHKIIQEEVEKKVFDEKREITKHYDQTLQEKENTIHFVEKQFKMVSEQFQALDKNFKSLGREKRQTEEIVRSMAEGVIMVNEQGEVMLMNPAAEKLLGVKKGEKIGKNILSDLKEEQLVSLAQDLTGKEEKDIVLQARNDQTQKILKASNAVIESEDGKTVGFVSVLSDVTKQRELDRLKESFIANISHDLRNPLNNIQESFSLLSNQYVGQLGPEQQRIVTIGLNNSRRLSRLINDLLDMSKLEAKKFTLKKAPFLLDQLLKNIAEEFQPWSRTKNILIETKVVDEFEIDGDQDRLSQVLTNLVGNALKFTPKDGNVRLEAVRKGTFAEVGVRDTGPGISKKDHDKIFQKFVQLETPNLQGIGGTGLGLAIAREIVELHGGRIWVESEEGIGSRFAFEIPVK